MEGLAGLLERQGNCTVVGRAATPAETLALAETTAPEIIVLDLMLGAADGLALIKDLRTRSPAARILVFTLQSEEIYAERCLRAGASGYVMKKEPVAELYAAIRTLVAGNLRFSPRVVEAVMAAALGRPRAAPGHAVTQLSDRELQVFRLTGLAVATKEIAAQLGVSVKTVEAHRENIKNKLGLPNHAALTARAAAWLRDTAEA